jgi:hypothetical protein
MSKLIEVEFTKKGEKIAQHIINKHIVNSEVKVVNIRIADLYVLLISILHNQGVLDLKLSDLLRKYD